MRLLSREDSSIITICGAGAQARTQLEAALIVCPSIKKVQIYDLVYGHSQLFAQEMGAKFPTVEITPVAAQDLGSAIEQSDILITVTLADDPFVKAEWIRKGTLIINMAAHEVEYGCISKADKIVVDFWETIKHRMSSSIAHMWADGLLKDDQIDAELGQIINGKKPGRDNNDQTIYFNAVGAGVLDLAVAVRCYRKAIEQAKGQVIPYWV